MYVYQESGTTERIVYNNYSASSSTHKQVKV